MKKTPLLLLFCFSFTLVFAGKLEKAFEALNEYNYFKAKELFEQLLEKENVAAPYGLSIIYERNDNPFHSIDSAYKYICLSDSNFLKLELKEKGKLLELQVDSISIEMLKDSIDKKAFTAIKDMQVASSFQNYLDTYLDSDYRKDARNSRNRLLFDKAKEENTAKAYRFFYETYPESKEAFEAQNRFEERLYAEETVGGKVEDYQRFIYKNCGSPFLRTAQDSIFSIMTRDRTIASYYQFIKENPSNPHFEKAWRQVYKLYMTDYSPEKIIEFRIDYPKYPFVEELKVDIKLASKRFLPFKKNQKWGFCDLEGKIMIEPQFESVEEFEQGLALVIKDGKVGYIDKAAKSIIPFQYEDGESFQNGLAIVGEGDFYGMINRANEVVLPMKYDYIGSFNNDLALVANEDYYGYCNPKGEIVIPIQLEYASDFENGYAVIEIEGKKGMINTLGKIVIPPLYEWLEPFDQYGLCRAKKDTLYGVLDKNGSEVLPFEYNQIGAFKNQRALVAQDETYGYVNIKGDMVIPLTLEYRDEVLIWGSFNAETSKFLSEGKIGIMDTTGDKVFPAIFQDVGLYQENDYTAVKKRGKWGYSDPNLKLAIPYEYDLAFEFRADKAIVKKDSLYGVINKEGDWLVEPTFLNIDYIEGLGYRTNRDGKIGLLGLDLDERLSSIYKNIVPINGQLVRLEKENEVLYYQVEKGKLIDGQKN